jgi:translocation and assembly module TamB
MKRRLKIIALVFGSLIGALMAFLAWVLYTEAGLRFAVARLPEKMGTVTLRVEGVKGTIAGGFSAAQVDVHQTRIRVRTRVENGTARVNVWPLLVGRIAVREARADLVHIEVGRREPRPRNAPRFMPRLLSISARRAVAKSLVIISPNGKRTEFSDVSGAGIVGNKIIRIFEASAVYGVLSARAIGELRAADPIKLSGEATTRMLIEGQPEWRADVSFAGDLAKLPLTGKLQAPFRADLRGELLELSNNFHWIGVAAVHNFDLRAFGAGGALGIVTGRLDVGGRMNAFHARGPLAVPGLGEGQFDTVFEGYYESRVVHSTSFAITHRFTGSHVHGLGTIETAQNGPKLALHGGWKGVRWPLLQAFSAQTPQIFSSPEGRFQLEGVWPYTLVAEGDLYVPQLDPMTVAVRGALHKDHLAIDELGLGAFGGTAQLAGEARWSPEESWALAGTVRGFDPATLRPGFSGALDFDLDARGKPFGSDGDLDVAFARVSGRLRGSSASGGGRVRRHADEWNFDKLRFRAGTLAVAVDGALGGARPIDLDFSIEADDLGLLADGARGALSARGHVGGSHDAPVVRLTAQGTGLEHGDVRIDRLGANVDVDWRGQRASHADIALSRIGFGERGITQFNLVLDGTTASHALKVDMLAGKTSLHLNGQGAFADGTWNGIITNLFIDDTSNINLRLVEPAAVMARKDAFRLAALCVLGKVAKLCGEGSWNTQGWAAKAEARDLPISTLTAGLTPRVEYQGTVNATASAAAARGAPLQGEARVDLVDAAIRHRLASGRTDVITFGSGFVTARAAPDHVVAELRLDAAARGLIAGRMRAERRAADLGSWPLRGQLQMATGELGFITLYLPAVDRASGHFDADLSFTGTLGRPSASGLIRLSGAELDLYQLNLRLRALETQARIVANNLEFTSAAKAGEGTLTSSGKIEWRDNLPYGAIHLEGANLRMVDVPEVRIDASPNLDFRIVGREMFVAGEVKLPRARIVPAELTNAVLPSADEKLVGPTEQVEKDPIVVSTEITMTLGDDVYLETLGLTGYLTGSITARTLPDQPSRASGELQVREGTAKYSALGRKLDIERGRLIYNGGLLADPAIDIRAVKIFPDVKAGVNVRGTLRTPRLSFFSEPSIPQSQIMGIILAGSSLDSVQQGTRANSGRQEAMVQAAGWLLSQYGEKFNFPDISVESDLSNETSLVLGRYLSPRLYVSYGWSVAETISTLRLQYTLDEHWTVKTEASGKERGADLLFTIEK